MLFSSERVFPAARAAQSQSVLTLTFRWAFVCMCAVCCSLLISETLFFTHTHTVCLYESLMFSETQLLLEYIKLFCYFIRPKASEPN